MLQLNCNGQQLVYSPQASLQERSNITNDTKTDNTGRQICLSNVIISGLISMSRSVFSTLCSFVRSLTDFTGITKNDRVIPKLISQNQEEKLDTNQKVVPEKIAEIQKSVNEQFNDVPKIYNRWRPAEKTLINNALQDQKKIPPEKLEQYLKHNMLEARREQMNQQASKDISFVTDKPSGSLIYEAKLFRKKTNIRLDSKKHDCNYKKYALLSASAKTQGNRPYMEDMSFIKSVYIKGNFITINSVCDGHSGKDIAKLCVENLTNQAMLNMIDENRNNNSINNIFICNMLRLLTVDVEKKCIKNLKPKTDDPEEHEKYTKAFSQGTTANICILTNDAIWTANVGDSRAIIIDPRGKAVQTSVTPNLRKPYFQEMVTKRGGSIYDVKGVYRVNAALNMASSIGDYHLFGATSPVSEITKFVRDSRDRSWDDYTIIQVTDGVTDVLTTQQIANLVNFYLKEGYSLTETAEEIVAVAYKLGSNDNITVTLQQRHSSS